MSTGEGHDYGSLSLILPVCFEAHSETLDKDVDEALGLYLAANLALEEATDLS